MLDWQGASKEILEKYAETENWFTYEDFYTKVAEEKTFETYVEVGCWKGHSTRFLLKKLQEAGKEFAFFAVDLWDKLDPKHELWEKYPEQMPVLRHIFNYNLIKSGTRKDAFDIIMDSVEAASGFEDESVDFVFLDASHDVESVRKDLGAWFPKISNNGIFSGHDFCSPPVSEAVLSFFSEKKIPLQMNQNQDIWAVVKRIK